MPSVNIAVAFISVIAFFVIFKINKRIAVYFAVFSALIFFLQFLSQLKSYYVATLIITFLVVLILTYIAKFSTLVAGVTGIFVTIFYAFVGIIFFDLLGNTITIGNIVLINTNIFYLILILWFIIDIYLISLNIDHNRRLYQLSSTLISDSYLKGFITASIYQGTTKGFCVPVLNCYACPAAIFSCPIGTIQHFMVIGGRPESAKMFAQNLPYYPLGLLGLVGASVGRMTCGYLCPFGFFQDILYKIKTHRVRVPKVLRHFKYVTLVVLVFFLPLWTGENWFSKLCPMGTLIGGIPWISINVDIRGMVRGIFWIKIAILLAYMVFSALSKRPFCQTTCPLGAIYSLFNKASFFKISWDRKTCTHCNKCESICPMDIKIYEDPNPVDCIRCLDCARCPSVSLTHPFSALEKEEEKDVMLSYKI